MTDMRAAVSKFRAVVLLLPIFGGCSSSSDAPASRTCWVEGPGNCACDGKVPKEKAPHPLVAQCSAESVGSGSICCTQDVDDTCVCVKVGCTTNPGVDCTCGFGEVSTASCEGADFKRCCKDDTGCSCDNYNTDCGASTKVASCGPSDVRGTFHCVDKQVVSCTP